MTTGTQKPRFQARFPCPPSSKVNVSGTSGRSTVAKESQKHGSGSQTRTDLSHIPNAQLGDREKREIKDKPHRWIEARVRHAWIRPATWRRSIHYIILGGMLAALPCKLWPSPTGVGSTWTWVSSTPYLHSPRFCSPPYRTHTEGRSQVPIKPSQVHASWRRHAPKKQRGLEVDGSSPTILGRRGIHHQRHSLQGTCMPRKCLGRVRP